MIELETGTNVKNKLIYFKKVIFKCRSVALSGSLHGHTEIFTGTTAGERGGAIEYQRKVGAT